MAAVVHSKWDPDKSALPAANSTLSSPLCFYPTLSANALSSGHMPFLTAMFGNISGMGNHIWQQRRENCDGNKPACNDAGNHGITTIDG